jgi:4-hydroxybenzoate polyprenyltransferase
MSIWDRLLAVSGKWLGPLLESFDQQFPRLPALLRLARLDRPIGIFLLLWPTLWSLWMAAEGFPGWHLLLVFVLGTVLTRSAGCIINDIFDRGFDGHVQRTANRPLVQGEVSVAEAVIFMGILLFMALLLVLSTNTLTVMLAFGAVIIAAIYPLMKRYTYMPQAVLGLAFAFGTPMAFAAMTGEVPQVAWLLVVANVVWTVAYDTQYAMVDRDDDLRLGLKSSAILFADMDRVAVGTLQILFLVIMYTIMRHVSLDNFYLAGLSCAAGLFVYQQYLIYHRQRDDCFAAFLNNHWVGLVIFLGVIGAYY